jgi:lysophospholipase L1-like esterase
VATQERGIVEVMTTDKKPTVRGRGVLGAALLLALGGLAFYLGARNRVQPAFYVALGDSYTSGPGIPPQIDTQSGCERSDRSYPVLVARHLGLSTARFRDASCSGARIADLTGPQSTGSAVNPPQLASLTAGTTLVTLGIGGNDLDFSGVVTRCVVLDLPGILFDDLRHISDDRAPCRASYAAAGTDQIRQAIQAAALKLSAALARIRGRAPHARVLVVGYPDLLPARGDACTDILGITPGDVAYLDSEELLLNRMLATRAAAAGDGYVDTYTPSAGHDACADPATRWIEPLLPDASAAPVHPNALGEQGIAGAVERAVAAAP